MKKITKKIEKIGELTRSFAKFKKILNDNDYEATNQADKKIKILVDKYRKQISPDGYSNTNSMRLNDFLKYKEKKKVEAQIQLSPITNILGGIVYNYGMNYYKFVFNLILTIIRSFFSNY